MKKKEIVGLILMVAGLGVVLLFPGWLMLKD